MPNTGILLPSPSFDSADRNKIQQEKGLRVLTETFDNLSRRIILLNTDAISLISHRLYPESLHVLSQAQKILEYAANCGKELDRYWIITILINKAFVLKKIQSFDDSLDYLQGVIVNFENWIKEEDNEKINQENSIQPENLCKIFNYKLNAVIHRIQYSKIAFKIHLHQDAIQSNKQALEHLKSLAQNLNKLENQRKPQNCAKLLKVLEITNNCLHEDFETQGLIAQVKEYLSQIIRQTYQDNSVFQNISDIFQLNPKTIDSSRGNILVSQMMSQKIIEKLSVYTAACYFTISKQLQILFENSQSHINNVLESYYQNSNNSIQQISFELVEDCSHIINNTIKTKKFNKSAINYHLMALKILLSLAPHQNMMINQLIQDFRNKYHIDLEVKKNRNENKNIIQRHTHLGNKNLSFDYQTSSHIKIARSCSSQKNMHKSKENNPYLSNQLICNIHDNAKILDIEKIQKVNSKSRINQSNKSSSPKVSLFYLAKKSNKSNKKTTYLSPHSVKNRISEVQSRVTISSMNNNLLSRNKSPKKKSTSLKPKLIVQSRQVEFKQKKNRKDGVFIKNSKKDNQIVVNKIKSKKKIKIESPKGIYCQKSAKILNQCKKSQNKNENKQKRIVEEIQKYYR